MQVVSAREFRANQGKYLTAARNGQSVMLRSRYGNFKISPVTEEDSLVARVRSGLEEAKMIEEGRLPHMNMESLLDEL